MDISPIIRSPKGRFCGRTATRIERTEVNESPTNPRVWTQLTQYVGPTSTDLAAAEEAER
jgi:hypothetical protein